MILLTSSMQHVGEHVCNEYIIPQGYKTVLCIDTATEPDGDNIPWFYADIKPMQDAGLEVNRFSVTDKTAEEIKEAIDTHDVIYMSGGNTFYLLQQFQKAAALDVLREAVLAGKPYIGSSAGSALAATDIALVKDIDEPEKAPDLTDTKGLDLVDFRVFPHWGSESFKGEYEKGFDTAYNNGDAQFIPLHDTKFIEVLDDGAFKIHCL